MSTMNELSLVDLAEAILAKKKEPVNLYELFDMVISERGGKADEREGRLNAFYADIVTSAKFVYMGENTWDLKRHQDVQLWEKDGSHYNEYREVEDEVMDKRLADQEAKELEHLEMLEKRKQAEIEAQEAEIAAEEAAEAQAKAEHEAILAEEEGTEVPELDIEEPVLETEDEVVEEKAETVDDAEETDEKYDDFDEEEYNEYMDEFEDKYDK